MRLRGCGRESLPPRSLLIMIAITFPGAMVARAAEHDSKMRARARSGFCGPMVNYDAHMYRGPCGVPQIWH